MNIAAALTKATEKLQAAGVTEPRREASSLLEFILRQNSAYLIAHSDDQLAANQKMIFDACVRRRANARASAIHHRSALNFGGSNLNSRPMF